MDGGRKKQSKKKKKEKSLEVGVGKAGVLEEDDRLGASRSSLVPAYSQCVVVIKD